MAEIEGWAVLKGWSSLPDLPGDLDLIVAEEALPVLTDSTLGFLLRSNRRRSEHAFVFQCDHIPGVPRIFAYLPEHGFKERLLEIDFAILVPLRGYRAVTYSKMRPFLQIDSLGFPRTSPEADEVIAFLMKSMTWFRANGEQEFNPAHRAILRSLLGRSTGALVSNFDAGTRLLPGLVSISLVARAFFEPTLVLERLRFRLRDRDFCPFDPTKGRVARLVSDPVALRQKAIDTGHELVATEM